MKKKVIIEKVPSSKKKVVIEGLPKAQAGIITTGTDPQIMEQTQNLLINKIKRDNEKSKLGITSSARPQDYDLMMQNQFLLQDKIQKDNNKFKQGFKKPNTNFKMGYPNIVPTVGNKYLQQSLMNFNDAFRYIPLIDSKNKVENLPPPTYNPYANIYWNYEEGGMLPLMQQGGQRPQQTFEKIQPLTAQQGLPNGQLSTNPVKLDFEKDATVENSQNPFQTAGAIAGTVSKLGLGTVNAIKGGLDIVGSNIMNRQAQNMENQLYTQSVFSDAMNVTPYETQGYGFQGRNALAADGMQIRQIGGMGEPNVEVEDSEHIQLPNGFSQEIKGKKHSEGGIPINLPQGTKIFSEKLKDPATKKSYADLAKKFETKKYVDLLNSPDADPIQKATAQLMIKQKNQKLEELFALQEQNKLFGAHGEQVQFNAMQEQQEAMAQEQEPMMMHGGLHKAQNGKEVILPNGKKVTAVKVKEPGKDYKPVPNMPGYYYRTITTTTPGTPGKAGVPPQKITKFMTNEQWKEYLKKETPEQKERRLKREQGIPAVPATPDIVKENEDYVYIEPEQQPGTPPAPQVINKTYEIPGMNLGIGLPNVYDRLPLNYYKIEPDYIDPRYLDIQPQLNQITRGQRALQSNIGGRGATDIANLLQAQANADYQRQNMYGQKYNYDRQQDAAAQQFNAQANMNINQYNQGSWFQQLEDPIRRREGAIETQKLMDAQAAIENAQKMQAFYNNKGFIDDTFYPYKNLTSAEIAEMLPVYNQAYQKGLEEGKKKQTKYGGRIKLKIKKK